MEAGEGREGSPRALLSTQSHGEGCEVMESTTAVLNLSACATGGGGEGKEKCVAVGGGCGREEHKEAGKEH